MNSFLPVALILVLLACPSRAFAPLMACQRISKICCHMDSTSRRSFVENLVVSSTIASIAVERLTISDAMASGGATAGGAYLLSAKQRYNDRVKSGTQSFLSLRKALESADIDTLRSFFASEDVGGWKDYSTAGYLLANAFRRTSTAAPDSLPSVKKWKAFAGAVEEMTKALKKKDTKAALNAYELAIVALDEYLEKVELPSAKEIASS